MKIELTSHRSGNSRLILIFAGWSTTPKLYSHISFRDWDVAVAYDYSSFDFNSDMLLPYSTIRVFAWSLGIVAAELSLKEKPEIRIEAAYALNGSLAPAHDDLGIPEKIFHGTSANLNQNNLRKFRRRMAGNAHIFSSLFNDDYSDMEIESLRRQLDSISKLGIITPELHWKCAYISDNDLIFPPDNVNRYWRDNGIPTISISGAHYVDFKDLLDTIIPETEKIANTFSAAKTTYNQYAIAQDIIARHLARKISESLPKKNCKILEIGPGTGILTQFYADILKPAEVDFVDIIELPHFGIASNERYFKEDAENWIKDCSKEYDYIISASTIQWFADLPEFFSHCQRLLTPGGKIFMSSFLPGNLEELDAIRPTPLLYLSETKLSDILIQKFKDVSIESETINLDFPSVRHLLIHLKNTGVGGGFSSKSKKPWSSLPNHLTYRPVYITATSSNKE